jgi:hypothetical protein
MAESKVLDATLATILTVFGFLTMTGFDLRELTSAERASFFPAAVSRGGVLRDVAFYLRDDYPAADPAGQRA